MPAARDRPEFDGDPSVCIVQDRASDAVRRAVVATLPNQGAIALGALKYAVGVGGMHSASEPP